MVSRVFFKHFFFLNLENAILQILTLVVLQINFSITYRVGLPYGFAAIDCQNEIM